MADFGDPSPLPKDETDQEQDIPHKGGVGVTFSKSGVTAPEWKLVGESQKESLSILQDKWPGLFYKSVAQKKKEGELL